MTQANSKKELLPSQVRLVVEVDGHPVGFLNLDLDRLWPLINHRKRDVVPVYQTLGDEMVKAELDVENVTLKAETAAQVFGRTKTEIEKFVADSGGTAMDFYTFFWEYLLEDREVTDLKKEWKTRDIPTR